MSWCWPDRIPCGEACSASLPSHVTLAPSSQCRLCSLVSSCWCPRGTCRQGCLASVRHTSTGCSSWQTPSCLKCWQTGSGCRCMGPVSLNLYWAPWDRCLHSSFFNLCKAPQSSWTAGLTEWGGVREYCQCGNSQGLVVTSPVVMSLLWF